ncbi:MAG: autoinducer binding domain-containing protein [Alphaproteobacteria bacterium]|nr:autoinducer binding domain-containing protein [Alphaproteobacteria bacterium]
MQKSWIAEKLWALRTARTLDELILFLQEILEAMEFDYFAFKPALYGPEVHTNFSWEWCKRYRDCDYRLIDPILAVMEALGLSFLWERARVYMPLNTEQKTIMAEARDAGLVSGAAFPVWIFPRVKGIISLASSMSDHDFARLFAARYEDIRLLLQIFCERFKQLMRND